MGMFRSGKRYHVSLVLPASFDEASEYIHASLHQYGDGNLFTGSQLDAESPRNWTAGRRVEVAADGSVSELDFKMQITLEQTKVEERCRVTVNAESRTRKLAAFERHVMNGTWVKGILNQCLGITAETPGKGID